MRETVANKALKNMSAQEKVGKGEIGHRQAALKAAERVANDERIATVAVTDLERVTAQSSTGAKLAAQLKM